MCGSESCRSRGSAGSLESDNVRVHRAAANSLNIETRATRGSACNPLLYGDASCHCVVYRVIATTIAPKITIAAIHSNTAPSESDSCFRVVAAWMLIKSLNFCLSSGWPQSQQLSLVAGDSPQSKQRWQQSQSNVEHRGHSRIGSIRFCPQFKHLPQDLQAGSFAFAMQSQPGQRIRSTLLVAVSILILF